MAGDGGGERGARRGQAAARGAEAAAALRARRAALSARAGAGLARGALRQAALERLAQERFRELDSNLLRLTLRWYAAAEAASAAGSRARSVDLQRRGRERALGLALLRAERGSVELAWETGGGVQSVKLDPADAEFRRCERAVRGHADIGGGGSVRVVGVRRVDNRHLLGRFQRAAAEAGPEARTMGLFCAVPRGAVPRVVCFGVGRTESTPPARVWADVFWPKWPSGPGDSAAEPGSRAARDAVRAAPPLDLPVAFSPTGQAPLAQLRMGADPGGAAAEPDEAVHHLLLCRVRVSRCAAVDCARGPPRHLPEGCDAVRDPERPDLTFVYHAEHVYPEFLVQVVLGGGGQGKTEGGLNEIREGTEEDEDEDEEWLPSGLGAPGGPAAEAEIQMSSIAAELQEAASDVSGLYRATQAALVSCQQRGLERLRARLAAAEEALESEVRHSEQLRRQMAAYCRARDSAHQPSADIAGAAK